MTSPYSNLEERSFWRGGVTNRGALDPGDIYRPKFPVTREMRIVTAGSCFAQHVGRTLRNANFNVQDAEPFPANIDDETAQKFGYRLFSGRYGNIYTTRQLVQLIDEMRGASDPALPVWSKGGRYFDSMRPNVEPEGLDSPESVMLHRKIHLSKIRRTFFNCDLIVFTFGLTEAWVHNETNTVYPTAPGTIAGEYDPKVFSFKNYEFDEVKSDFEKFMGMMRRKNPGIKFLITTSPVPLTATATDQHVEVATCYSKSVLRAVCGSLYDRHDDVDYFPSYEIITSANNRGVYFEPNKRNVSDLGVQTAMGVFMQAHDPDGKASRGSNKLKKRRANRVGNQTATQAAIDEVCEEALLEAFSK